MTPLNQLTWENFVATVFVTNERRVHRVMDTPCVEVVGDGERNLIALLLEVPAQTQLPPALAALAIVDARLLSVSGRCILELSTRRAVLHRQFYHFAMAVAERMRAGDASALDAVLSELACFAALFEQLATLGVERQIGLLGELLFLERLANAGHTSPVDSWLGWMGEPHDFRIAAREFEVKATVAAQRSHIIHGLQQLVPSHGCTLHIVSVLLGPAGAGHGFSLPDKIDALMQRLAPAPAQVARLEAALSSLDYRHADAVHYQRRYALRRPLAVVSVDDNCPAITPTQLRSAVGALLQRIGFVEYAVTLDGLEHEDGTEEFTVAITP
jgi:hypothetical protein